MPSQPSATKKTDPSDVFLYLLAIVTLYITAVNLGILLSQLVDYFVSDPLAAASVAAPSEMSRFSLSWLVTAFPVYLWASRKIERDLLQDPEKRKLLIRRWLLYFTLFVTSLIIIGDVAVLINSYLSGDLTAKVALKIAAVLLIAASVFKYYLWNVQKDICAWSDRGMRIFIKAVILAVLAAIVGGFLIAGSPAKVRLRRFDVMRVQDLDSLQNQILSFWGEKRTLPESLSDLADFYGTSYELPKDPVSGAAYEYRVLEKNKFELCAVFQTEGEEYDSGSSPKSIYDWRHGAERTCFTRTASAQIVPL